MTEVQTLIDKIDQLEERAAKLDRKRRNQLVATAVAILLLLLGQLQIRHESEKRTAFACSTAHMFDESIRITGRAPQGEMGRVYREWKHDNAANCPKENP